MGPTTARETCQEPNHESWLNVSEPDVCLSHRLASACVHANFNMQKGMTYVRMRLYLRAEIQALAIKLATSKFHPLSLNSRDRAWGPGPVADSLSFEPLRRHASNSGAPLSGCLPRRRVRSHLACDFPVLEVHVAALRIRIGYWGFLIIDGLIYPQNPTSIVIIKAPTLHDRSRNSLPMLSH